MSNKQYIIISPSAMFAGEGTGYWSVHQGWTLLEFASRFTEEDKDSLVLPKAIGDDAAWMELPAGCDESWVHRAVNFRHMVGTYVNAMSQDDSRGQVFAFERLHGNLMPTVIDPEDVALGDLGRYEMLLFDGGNSSGDSWKQVFHPQTLMAMHVNENPLPSQGVQAIEVSLDGGQTYQSAPSGVRMVYKDVLVNGEECEGEIHINATHEGVITDVWCKDPDGSDRKVGTRCEMIEDLTTLNDLAG